MVTMKEFLVVGLLVIVAITMIKADNLDELKYEDIPDPPEMTCKNAVSLLTKRMLNGLSQCTKKMKFKNGKEKAAKSACLMRCVAIHEGMLQEDGYYSDERMKKFVKREVPVSLREKVEPIITECFTKHKIEHQDDEFCKQYEPLFKCLMDKIPTFCS